MQDAIIVIEPHPRHEGKFLTSVILNGTEKACEVSDDLFLACEMASTLWLKVERQQEEK